MRPSRKCKSLQPYGTARTVISAMPSSTDVRIGNNVKYPWQHALADGETDTGVIKDQDHRGEEGASPLNRAHGGSGLGSPAWLFRSSFYRPYRQEPSRINGKAFLFLPHLQQPRCVLAAKAGYTLNLLALFSFSPGCFSVVWNGEAAEIECCRFSQSTALFFLLQRRKLGKGDTSRESRDSDLCRIHNKS